MEFHPIANLFPLMQGEELEELKQDIAHNGLIEPIWLHPDGRIVDGRNRWRVCDELGIIPHYNTWNGHGSLIEFVLSLNLHRRHLTSGQRATVALDVLPMLEAEARERQREAGQEHGRGQNSSVKSLTELSEPQRATQTAATLLGTNRQYVCDAKRIRDEEPEVFEQVKNGELTIPQAKDRLSGRSMKPKQNYKGEPGLSGPMDRCQTPTYAFSPVAKYLNSDWLVWEPARGEGYLSKAIRDNGFDVIESDILTEQNFFEYEPEQWNCLVTNPPFSIKYDWLARCYELSKPFALLLPVETIGAKSAQELFKQYDQFDLEIIFLDRRVNFKMPNKGWDGSAAQFPVAWFTWGLNIGRQIIFEEIAKDEE